MMPEEQMATTLPASIGSFLPNVSILISPKWDDGRTDTNTHEEVDPTQVETDSVQNHREGAHAAPEDHNDELGNEEDLLSCGLWINVGPVNVISHEGRHRNALCRACGCDCHE